MKIYLYLKTFQFFLRQPDCKLWKTFPIPVFFLFCLSLPPSKVSFLWGEEEGGGGDRALPRSEWRRVGEEWCGTFRRRGGP